VCLTLPILGAVTEEYGHEAVTVNGPAVVLHPAGQYHSNEIHRLGLDCLSIRFDPTWLSSFGFSLKLERSMIWQGSEIPRRGRELFASWTRRDLTERNLAAATATFIDFAVNQLPVQQPSWMECVVDALRGPEPPSTAALAKELGLHPAWLARAYKQTMGEGLASTRCRLRMEVAAALLRESDEPLSKIAVAAGFCDQSHMARVCLAYTARTPLQLRREVQALR
jgi:AraC-like DNA-binding protein